MSDSLPAIEIGDKFVDLDPREGDRIIKIVAVESSRRFRYITVVNTWAPSTVNNPNKVHRGRGISAATLRRRYKKISR